MYGYGIVYKKLLTLSQTFNVHLSSNLLCKALMIFIEAAMTKLGDVAIVPKLSYDLVHKLVPFVKLGNG